MCKCCEEISFWRIANKEEENTTNVSHKIFAKIAIYGWRKGERKIKGNQLSTVTTKAYDLNYCPTCGRKI